MLLSLSAQIAGDNLVKFHLYVMVPLEGLCRSRFKNAASQSWGEDTADNNTAHKMVLKSQQ